MKSFPKIKQFINIIRKVRENHDFKGMIDDIPVFKHDSPYPSLVFTGTVKIHGTNASVDSIGNCYSRSREIKVCDDNYGFAAFIKNLSPCARRVLSSAGEQLFGEWCGIGINAGCGIHELPRRFIIFSVLSSDEFSKPLFTPNDLKTLNECGIYSIMQFDTVKIEVDFNQPELSDFASLVLAVEGLCPVADFFGVEGIGEGLVWTCDNDPSEKLWFKTKGEKHSVTKVKAVASCDIEKAESISDFADKTVTRQRLMQGIESLKADGIEIEHESTGDYLRWVFNDIVDEESEMMGASGLDKNDVGKAISYKAKIFWFNYINRELI